MIFNPRTFTSNLTHNLGYFFVGRYAGMLGYFFPGVLRDARAPRRAAAAAALAVAGARRRRSRRAWSSSFITPYTWSGGGVGNRYFCRGYGVMLFLLPPIESVAAALVAVAIVGGLFAGADGR